MPETMHHFQPWTQNQSTLTLAAPAAWEAIDRLPDGTEVLVGCDVFSPWDGPIANRRGEPLNKFYSGVAYPLAIADIRADLFALIDRTPNLRWLLPTEHVELVRKILVPLSLKKDQGHVSQNEGDGYHLVRRENVTVLPIVHSQAEADTRIPAALRLVELCEVGVRAIPTGYYSPAYMSGGEMVEPDGELAWIDLRKWLEPHHVDSCINCGENAREYVNVRDFEFSSHGDLICPSCGDSSACRLTGDDSPLSIILLSLPPDANDHERAAAEDVRRQCAAAGIRVEEENQS